MTARVRRRILFYVQHLLGIGHLMRAGRIAAALAETCDVVLALGGEPVPGLAPAGVDILQLPPVKAGAGGFSALVHPDGRVFDEAAKAARRDRLLAAFDAARPDVLLVEAFPFGRSQMRFELLPLLERAAQGNPRPLIACSVRDILQDRRAERQEEAVALVRRFFDLVLVHGDPGLVRLSDSFPAAARFADRIRYTGMVGPEPSGTVPEDEIFDVVVSVGGGAVGARLVEAAIAARPLTSLRDARWLVLTGPNGAVVPAAAGDGLVTRPFVSDLPARLARARVSVSQAGYNTVADLVAARCPAVLVPFVGKAETEQSRRAALFRERGWAVVVEEERLSAVTLAGAVEAALALPERGSGVDLDGARRSRLLLDGRHDRADLWTEAKPLRAAMP